MDKKISSILKNFLRQWWDDGIFSHVCTVDNKDVIDNTVDSKDGMDNTVDNKDGMDNPVDNKTITNDTGGRYK